MNHRVSLQRRQNSTRESRLAGLSCRMPCPWSRRVATRKPRPCSNQCLQTRQPESIRRRRRLSPGDGPWPRLTENGVFPWSPLPTSALSRKSADHSPMRPRFLFQTARRRHCSSDNSEFATDAKESIRNSFLHVKSTGAWICLTSPRLRGTGREGCRRPLKTHEVRSTRKLRNLPD